MIGQILATIGRFGAFCLYSLAGRQQRMASSSLKIEIGVPVRT